jgi:hypothetical protein
MNWTPPIKNPNYANTIDGFWALKVERFDNNGVDGGMPKQDGKKNER